MSTTKKTTINSAISAFLTSWSVGLFASCSSCLRDLQALERARAYLKAPE